MLEMYGFNPASTEAYWKGRLSRKDLKTDLDLFLISYDIMRLHFPQVQNSALNEQKLVLGQDKELDIIYYGSPRIAIDRITIHAHRGFLSEEIMFNREVATQTLEETTFSLQGYTPQLLQRRLDSDETPEAYPILSEPDLMNTALTLWRARAYVGS